MAANDEHAGSRRTDDHSRHVGRAIHVSNQAHEGCVDGLCGRVCVCVRSSDAIPSVSLPFGVVARPR